MIYLVMKNHRLTTRATKIDILELEATWQSRYKLHPDYPRNKTRVPFKSKSEYILYLIKCLNLATANEWWLFVNMLDYQYKEKYG